MKFLTIEWGGGKWGHENACRQGKFFGKGDIFEEGKKDAAGPLWKAGETKRVFAT
jgi:hypothetical protein